MLYSFENLGKTKLVESLLETNQIITIANNKRRFLSYELSLLTLKAALSTRDDKYPIYDKDIKTYQRSEAKKVLREWLSKIKTKYSEINISEAEHVAFIAEVAADLSNKLFRYLHNGRFRVGVAQKLVNVHLKYLWTAGFCPEPPHCPIDGIIRDVAGISYIWTQNDSIEEYKTAIASLKVIAETKGRTLAQWELETFRRRDDEEL
jgi:hypothetical protein